MKIEVLKYLDEQGEWFRLESEFEWNDFLNVPKPNFKIEVITVAAEDGVTSKNLLCIPEDSCEAYRISCFYCDNNCISGMYYYCETCKKEFCVDCSKKNQAHQDHKTIKMLEKIM